MIEKFKQRVIGQDHIFDSICKYIKIGEAGLSPEHEPKAAFMFLGPTGTGKTETAKVMSDLLHIPLIRFDMSEYSVPERWLNDFSAKLEGKETGVILLDEIEKGAKEIMDYFLQLLSEAKITVNRKEIDISNFYVVMTSNIGSKDLIGEDFRSAQYIVELRTKGYFRPEFLGRFHRKTILCFRPFDYDTIKQVAKLKIEQELCRLKRKGYDLSYTDKVVSDMVIYNILERELGARPIVQAIQEVFPSALLASGKKQGTFDVVDGKVALV